MDGTETRDTPGDLALVQTLAREGKGEEPRNEAVKTGEARYELGRELGRGGMGRVVEAIDHQFNRVVAVKQVHADRATTSTLRRFATEALVTGNLEHPGIPAVYERGVDGGGRPFYAMRRAQGRTLARLLAEADTRDKRLALLPVVTRVAQTIGFAHDRGVIHRDIKPDNIVVGDHGETFVLDWGLARVRGVPVDDAGTSAPSGGGTQYGSVVGTPAYMAPEQAAGDLDRIDERTDVFALGALLYHVITGAAPYRADTVDKLVEAAKAAKLAPIADPALPRELIAICHRATAREPAERYRDAHELARALETFGAHAVLGRPSRAVLVGTDVVLATLIAGILFGMYALVTRVSSLHDQGPGAVFVYAVSSLGIISSAIEWRTRGRYRLGAASFAIAFITFFGAVALFATGVSNIAQGAWHSPDEVSSAVLAHGFYEAVGTIAIAGQLVALQLALWAVARRRAQRSDERGSGAIV
jgi:hypothetical protein